MTITPQVLVIGGIYLDHLVRGRALPRAGATLTGTQYRCAPGGKGANQAVAISRQRVAVAMVGRVGDDAAGQRVLDALRHEGVDVTHVRTIPGQATGTAVVQVDARGEKQILAVAGATAGLNTSEVDEALAACPRAAILVTQLEAGLAVADHAIRRARERGMTVVLDPSPAAPLPDDLLRFVDVIKPDASEAAVLTGIRPHDRASAVQAAQRLLEKGVAAVVVQAGDDGDVLVDRHGEHWLPRHAVTAVDATGAGDALVGVLAARLALERPLQEAARWASAAAGLATTAFGAQDALPTPQEIMTLLKE